MTFAKAITIALFGAAALFIVAPAAQAQMGGGGMGSPSASGPDPQVAYNAGVAAYQAQNYPEAIRQLRTARRAAPTNSTINYALGLAYIGAGQKDDAKEALARAVRDPRAPVAAWLQLGLVSLELGDRQTAVAQQTALQTQLTRCDAACGEARRSQLQIAYDQLTRAINAAPAT